MKGIGMSKVANFEYRVRHELDNEVAVHYFNNLFAAEDKIKELVASGIPGKFTIIFPNGESFCVRN